MAGENSSIIPVQVQVRLPQDLEEEVQLRLPVKSLFRFKSVCKTWRSTFESRRFMALYRHHRPRGVYNSPTASLHTIILADVYEMVPRLNLQYEDTTLRTYSADGEKIVRAFNVFGPLSNGIYCITAHCVGVSSRCCYILSSKIALCNPATREYKYCDPFPREFRPMLAELSAVRVRCRLHYGFGKIINNNSESVDYRIVALIQYGTDPLCTDPLFSFFAFVYSVQSREWKKIVDFYPGKRKVGEPKAMDAFDLQGERRIRLFSNPLEVCTQSFFKGCCFWTVHHRDASFSVLLFNVADESFSLLGGPPDHMDCVTDKVFYYKGGDALVLHDHLAFFRIYNVKARSRTSSKGFVVQSIEVSVWMMMEYGVEESWTRIYKVNPDFNGHCTCLYGIHYKEDEECGDLIRIEKLILRITLDNCDEAIISCDKAGHQVIETCDPNVLVYLCWNTVGISTYIETLERL